MKMSEFFRSKSCHITAAGAINSFSTPGILKSSSVHNPSRYHHHHKEKEEEDEEEEETLEGEYLGDNSKSPATTPFSGLEERRRRRQNRSSSMNHLHHRDCNANDNGNQFPEGPGGIMGIVVAALRNSFLVTCSGLDVDMDTEVCSSNTVMDIGWPTDVRHVSHVTFDPFHGFLGLPFDLQYHLPTGYALPSAGSKLILLAWFRELPTGVLGSLTPEQVMHCNTEKECTLLVNLLPRTDAALLDWAINLMADIVQHEECNKMNARNIALVFAPNMTQMADQLNALIHAVQVMNFL